MDGQTYVAEEVWQSSENGEQWRMLPSSSLRYVPSLRRVTSSSRTWYVWSTTIFLYSSPSCRQSPPRNFTCSSGARVSEPVNVCPTSSHAYWTMLFSSTSIFLPSGAVE